MAVDTATLTRYEQVGVREQLSDKVYDISPMDFPVMSAIGRGAKATNTKVEWQKKVVRSAKTNKLKDGDDAVLTTVTPHTRLANWTQIFGEAVSVSGTAQAVSTAGRKDDLANAVMYATKGIKRDIETALCANAASDDGSRGTARGFGGIESWLTTNVDRGSGGSSGGYNSGTYQTAAATDASSTNQRTITEAKLKTVLGSIWTNSDEGCAPLVVVGIFSKQKVSSFSGRATASQQYPMGPKSSKSLAIIGAADIYVSDTGVHRIVPSRFSRARSALLLNPEYLSARYLRPFKVEPLAKTGDADKKQLIAELTLEVGNEAAHGVLADLKTS